MARKFIDVLNDGKLIMWLDISTYCNAGCPACHRTDRVGLGSQKWLPLVQWSFEQFKFAYSKDFIKKVPKWEICGTWGDPVMNKDLFEICEYITANSSGEVAIDTNGSIRPVSWWTKLGKLPNISVNFAVEGITQEMHSHYRRKTNLFKILGNMKAFTDAGGEAHVFCVIHKHNQDYLFEIEELCREYGAKYFSWNESNRFQYGPKMHFISETGERTYLEQTDGNYNSPGKIRNKGMMVDYKTRTDFQDVALKVKEAQKEKGGTWWQ